jgi:hypothetical protein
MNVIASKLMTAEKRNFRNETIKVFLCNLKSMIHEKLYEGRREKIKILVK